MLLWVKWAVNASAAPQNRRRRYEYTFVGYYKGIGDSASYIKFASSYYNQYYMTVPVDSVKRQDSINNAKRFAAAKTDTMYNTGNKRVERRTVAMSNISQEFSNSLADAARNVYMYDRQKQYTQLALNYAKRALEFYETPTSLNTCAVILYNNGEKAQAIQYVEKIISMLQKYKLKTTHYDDMLAKMKAGDRVEM